MNRYVRGLSDDGHVAAEYNHEEKHPDLGEVAIEYLKRLSPKFRLYLAIEGGEGGSLDEWEQITGVQHRIPNTRSSRSTTD